MERREMKWEIGWRVCVDRKKAAGDVAGITWRKATNTDSLTLIG